MAILFLSASSVSSHAQTMTFDCDAAENRSASVAIETASPFEVHGSLMLKESRRGDYAPVAGVTIDMDRDNGVFFRVRAPQPDAKFLELEIVSNRSGTRKTMGLGQLPAESAFDFTMTLTEAGNLTVTIDEAHFSATLQAFETARVRAFCSTGEFVFSGLSLAVTE
ncbi:hypothetical protein [Stakelama tenebrarum]|uniref:Uncharacterized protein n=1 Tax=Stakelama tenebrarum TaxID=2711215 RepID=A0A6G6Y6N6_9SPHN|nr:hypothetical protein [Sphingosinithalassobacter tenebrarum]QIG80585.1 hypothetical protein G5C33_12875 [Sphingosinithalassobacter tenebrarum]